MAARSHPDFSGVWRLVRERSTFGFLDPPKLREDWIQHRDPDLILRTRQVDSNGDNLVERRLTIGDPAVPIEVLGRPRTISAQWRENGTLLVITEGATGGRERRIEDRWTLAPDGETLTIERRHALAGGDVAQKLVFRKQA